MMDAEKVNHYNIVSEIRQRIGACFGTADGIFAGHHSDEKQAKELRKLAAANSISLIEVQEIVLGYLYGKGFTPEHIKEQYEAATELFEKKLK